MQAPSPRVRKKSAYHHGNLRGALVAATFDIARRAGVESITLRAVAARAGVSAPAAYHHFADKRELLAAAAGIAFSDLDARFVRALEAHASPERQLVALAGAYVTFAIEDPGALRLVLGAHVADLDLAATPEAVSGRRAKSRIRAVAREIAGERGEDLFRMAWAQALGMAMLVLEKELDTQGTSAPDVQRAVALTEEAVRRMVVTFRAS
jgi:AcrR family transcriptional regulator